MQVPVVVTLAGGVVPATVALPLVGVLLRLSLSCYLKVPLASVAISSEREERDVSY